MPQMRLMVEAFEQIKTADPYTALTLNGLKRLIRTGAVPSVKIGRKTLVNFDALIEYLSDPQQLSA